LTDLDGTLLDSHYGWRAAGAMIKRLRRQSIPLVLSTSKTGAELSPLRRRMRHGDPYIAENGGTLGLPAAFLSGLGFPYALRRDVVLELGWNQRRLSTLLEKLAREAEVRLRTLPQMKLQEVAQRTGLTIANARRARKRENSMPFTFVEATSNHIQRFLRAAEEHGAKVAKGARFWHLTMGSDKGDAMNALVLLIRLLTKENVQTIAAGDSPIDLPMLRQADLAVLFPGSDATVDPQLQRSVPKALVAHGNGPDAWAEAIEEALSRLRARPKTGIMTRRPVATANAPQALALLESFASRPPASRWRLKVTRRKAASRSLFP